MKRDPRIDAVAAGDLSSAAILAALIGMLGAKGMLSDEEAREVYEQAHYLLETHQAENEPEMRPIYESARGSSKRSYGPRARHSSARPTIDAGAPMNDGDYSNG